MRGDDFTKKVLDWLCTTHELTDEEATPTVAGLFIGVALASRHPTYAAAMHDEFEEDYRRRTAKSDSLFQTVSVTSGDERTMPKRIADELVQACPLPT